MEVVADQAVKNRLLFDNPWWALDENAPQKFKQPPKRLFFNDFARKVEQGETGQAVILCGPRRVGKTVMIRQMVARLIENGANPRHVLLASLSVPSYWTIGLRRVIELFVERNAEKGDNEAPLYAFLDEAQYMPNWEDDLKAVAKDFPRVRIVAALSAGGPTPAEMEAGKIDFTVAVLPPITFAEFLRFRGREEELFGSNPAKNHQLDFKQSNMSQLNRDFNHYINYGSFPESVMTKSNSGAPSPLFVRDGLVERLLHKDMASFFGINDLKGLSNLFTLLAYNTGREVSIEELAKATGIAKNTLRKYLDYLESAWMIRRLHRVDRNAKRFQRAVAFKVFIIAPCWYTALFGPVNPKDEAYERLVQTAVFVQWLGAPRLEGLTYASWRGGKVDLVGFASLAEQKKRAPEPNLVIEMDWQQKMSGFGEGPQTVTEFVRMNCNGDENTLLLTHNLVRTGYHRHVKLQSIPASLYAYGLVNELAS